MPRRALGRTGMQASIIGLGCEHLEGKEQSVVDEVIWAALDNDINIMDVFMPGDVVRSCIGKALGPRRKKVLLQGHIGVVDFAGSFRTRDLDVCKKGFNALLENLGTDYIDLGMMFYIDTEQDFEQAFSTPYYDYVRSLKQSGVIRAIGASSHNPAIATRMVEGGYLDVLMFSINPAYDRLPPSYDFQEIFEGDNIMTTREMDMEPARAHLYTLCEQKGVGITVMKPLGAGWLINPDQTPFSKPLTVAQCIHYALTRPGVVSALVGCKNEQEVAEAAAYVTLSDEQRDYRDAIAGGGSLHGKCMYCNHCLPCPANLDIAAVTKLLDRHRIHGEPIAALRDEYDALEHTAEECISCGSCESNCPFGVSVIENMQQTASLF